MKYAKRLINLFTNLYIVFAGFVVTSLGIMMYFYFNGALVVSTKLGGPEQFGQFGDFIGGLLNPVFGFLTVCLLLATNGHARKELELSRQEYIRRQLEDAIQQAFKSHDELLDAPIRKLFHPFSEKSAESLRQCMVLDSSFTVKFYSKMAKDWRLQSNIPPELVALYSQLDQNIGHLAHLTYDLIKLTHNNSLKNHWMNSAKARIADCNYFGIIADEEAVKFEDILEANYNPAEWN